MAAGYAMFTLSHTPIKAISPTQNIMTAGDGTAMETEGERRPRIKLCHWWPSRDLAVHQFKRALSTNVDLY